MKRFLALLTALACTLSPAVADNPKADAKAVVTSGNARFTVLTPQLIRMEWSADGQFEDRATLTFVNRETPVPEFKVRESKSKLTITTPVLTLTYLKNGKFSDKNLKAVFTLNGREVVWTPGMENPQNLLGTTRTLDGADGSKLKEPMEQGILSRAGWSLIDDSQRHVLTPDGSEWEEWVEARPEGDRQDLYLFAYGHDYKAALRDFTLFAGKMPLPPRYAFGYWWSRYWAYSDKELRTLVKNFRAYDIPLDVLVIDMDWHYTDGDRGGWTGWSWNRTLFPDPAKFLRWLDGEGIRSTFNLHPADGVRCGEDSYADVARDMGIDPASKQTVPWVSSDKKFIRSIFRRILTPMERDGVDFWWLDWQQQPTDPAVEGLSNTWWLNYVFFSDMEKNRDVRPMLYHRWGGLGNHRYQIGFSGDASITWASLDFQPYFNSTASNVLYGYWSHDIGGHHMADRIDPELYIRWMQFGALSPVMRTHSAKSAGLKKEVWNFAPEHADILRSTIRQRYALAPYIYTMARKAYDEGISLCRPMYYEWPEASEAYAFRNQYLFGDDILVAPVTAPGKEGYATVKVWLPEGKWYEWQTGTMLDGGRTVERTFALDEYPVYVRAGAILPMYGDTVKNLNANDEEILLTLFPGGSGEFSLYEDNGDDKRYAAEFARTHLKSVRNGNLLTVTVGKRTGAYCGMPAERKFSVKVLASAAPASVTVDGAKADWTYLGEEFALVVEIPRTDCAAEKVVCIRYEDAEVDFNGVPAAARRMARAMEEFKYHAARKPWEQSWRYTYTDEFGPMGSIAEAVEYAPERIPQLIGEFRKAYDDLPGVLRRQGLSQEESEWFLNQIAYNR